MSWKNIFFHGCSDINKKCKQIISQILQKISLSKDGKLLKNSNFIPFTIDEEALNNIWSKEQLGSNSTITAGEKLASGTLLTLNNDGTAIPASNPALATHIAINHSGDNAVLVTPLYYNQPPSSTSGIYNISHQTTTTMSNQEPENYSITEEGINVLLNENNENLENNSPVIVNYTPVCVNCGSTWLHVVSDNIFLCTACQIEFEVRKLSKNIVQDNTIENSSSETPNLYLEEGTIDIIFADDL